MSKIELGGFLLEKAAEAEKNVAEIFINAEATAMKNQQKVLEAFRECRVSDSHFGGTTGYGYDDRGREVLNKVFALSTGAEDALVSNYFVSGTHTLTVALFGILRPKDTLLAVTGKPYDTLDEVIGIKECDGSLKDFGVNYRQVDFKNGKIDFDGIKSALTNDVKAVFIQRSKGYMSRPSLTCEDIGEICSFVKNIKSDVIVMVDNCYGEFVEETEPTEYGADLIIGSMIKNPGGGMAQTGGYIAGKTELVEKCACRLTSPGIGREVGATLNTLRDMFKGVFLSPHITCQALKTAVFAAALFESLGFSVNPKPLEKRTDIIEAVELLNKDAILAFCKGIQSGAPVDSFVTPEPWDMPGYDAQVVMAAGAFIQGASIELSADAPIKPPYTVFFQGGLTYESGKLGVLLAAKELMDKGFIKAQ